MANNIETVDLTELVTKPTPFTKPVTFDKPATSTKENTKTQGHSKGALAVLHARQAAREAEKKTSKSTSKCSSKPSSHHSQPSRLPDYGSYGRQDRLSDFPSTPKKRKHAFDTESQSSRKPVKTSKKESIYAFPAKESTKRVDTKKSPPKFCLPASKGKLDAIMSTYTPAASYTQNDLPSFKATMAKADGGKSASQDPSVKQIMANVKNAGVFDFDTVSTTKRSSATKEVYTPPPPKPAKSRFAAASRLAFASSDSDDELLPAVESKRRDSLFMPASPAEKTANTQQLAVQTLKRPFEYDLSDNEAPVADSDHQDSLFLPAAPVKKKIAIPQQDSLPLSPFLQPSPIQYSSDQSNHSTRSNHNNYSNDEDSYSSTQSRLNSFWDSQPSLGFQSRKEAFEKQARHESNVRDFFAEKPHLLARRPSTSQPSSKEVPRKAVSEKPYEYLPADVGALKAKQERERKYYSNTTHDNLPLLPSTLTTPPVDPEPLLGDLNNLPALLGECQARWCAIMRKLQTENDTLRQDTTTLNLKVEAFRHQIEDLQKRVQSVETEQSEQNEQNEHMSSTFRNFAGQMSEKFMAVDKKLDRKMDAQNDDSERTLQ